MSLGYNQNDLGRELGLTFQQIQKYEKGANRISASKLWRIARFFNVDVNYFFEGIGPGTAPGGPAEEAEPPQQNFTATRHTIELARIAPSLPVRRQRLVLDLVRELAGCDGR